MAAEKSKPVQRCPKGALFIESESAVPGGRGLWYCRAPADHTIEDVLKPDYFGLSQGERGLRCGDMIYIEPESALWAVTVRIMALMPSIQQVKVREVAHMRQVYEVKPPSGFRFEWAGMNERWQIYKGEVLVDGGFDNQDECLERVQELMRQKAA